MKVAEAKTTATAAKSNSPFFQKGAAQSLLTTEEAPQPFFQKKQNDQVDIQAKLSIGQPNDKYEQEADAMADKVVQRLSTTTTDVSESKPSGDIQAKPLAAAITPVVQKKCATCEQEEKLQKKEDDPEAIKGELQKKPIFESNTEPPPDDDKPVQKKCEACEYEKEKEVQKKPDSVAPQAASPSVEANLSASKGSGSPMPESTKTQMESSFGADFSGVRIHNDSKAAQMSTDLNAQAFTHGNDVYFNKGKYDPQSDSGKHLLAHELTHTVQQAGGIGLKIQRDTPTELIERYTDWGGLNLQEDNLGAYLARQALAGNYQIVVDVINSDDLAWSDKDDVSYYVMSNLSIQQIIAIARIAAGISMLQILKDNIGDWNRDSDDNVQLDILSAVLEDGPDRQIWNTHKITTIKETAPSDLEGLALLFESDEIIDNGDIDSRMAAILKATEHLVIPGLQTGVSFSDTGFAGDRNPGGAGFRDPHPSSQNQVGHFLTAVGLQFSPGVISRSIPFFGSIRRMVNAPASMSDQDVALRLTIGHEKAPDPNGTAAAVDLAATLLIESILPGPDGETDDERDERIGRVMEAEARRQVQEIIQAFVTQFNAVTEEDLTAWNAALTALGDGPELDLAAAEPLLRTISIHPEWRGNSIQDLRLSLVGWKLGQLLGRHYFGAGTDISAWIRRNLGPRP
jgi:hypothetical protein